MKTILSLLCAMTASAFVTILVACDKGETSLSEYSITISAAAGGSAVAMIGDATVTTAAVGTNVTLRASESSGYLFAGWIILPAGVAIVNPTTDVTTFTMPANDVVIEPRFETVPTEYAITLTATTGGTAVAKVNDVAVVKAAAGREVTLTAIENNSKFLSWTTSTEGVAFASPKSLTTTFVMPAADVAIVAEFEDRNPQIYDKGVMIGTLRWATRNVGARGKFATAAEDYGGYYTFEEAQTACPAGWRLPTLTEFGKVGDSANAQWIVQSGANGIKISTDSASIFLPAAGYRSVDGHTIITAGEYGFYWSSTPLENGYSYKLQFSNTNINPRYYGQNVFGDSVRCVSL